MIAERPDQTEASVDKIQYHRRPAAMPLRKLNYHYESPKNMRINYSAGTTRAQYCLERKTVFQATMEDQTSVVNISGSTIRQLQL